MNILSLIGCRFKAIPYFWDFSLVKLENFQKFLPLVNAFLNIKT